MNITVTIGRYDFTEEVQDGLTDNHIELLKEMKDVGVFFSDAFGGAEIQIVGCGRRYYALYQMSGTILEIKTADEVKDLLFESSKVLHQRRIDDVRAKNLSWAENYDFKNPKLP